MVVVTLISSYIVWFGVKILGGQGKATEVYYLQSKLLWPTLVASIIVGVLTMIPILGFLINLAWTIYSIYLMVTLLAVVGKVSKLKALAGAIIVIVIVGIIAFILAMIVGLSVIKALASP